MTEMDIMKVDIVVLIHLCLYTLLKMEGFCKPLIEVLFLLGYI